MDCKEVKEKGKPLGGFKSAITGLTYSGWRYKGKLALVCEDEEEVVALWDEQGNLIYADEHISSAIQQLGGYNV